MSLAPHPEPAPPFAPPADAHRPTPRPADGAEACWRPRGPVLLATHGAAGADAATQAAAYAAAAIGRPLRALAVYEPLPMYPAHAGGLGIEAAYVPYDADLAAEERRLLGGAVRDGLARVLVGAGAADGAAVAEVPVEVVDGERWRAVVDAAERHGAALVVLGGGRHRLRDRVFSGELALQVLRRAPCPVLSVPPDWGGPPTTAVAGVDFSAASVRAAQAALRLVARGGRLVLVHVQPLVAGTRVLPHLTVPESTRSVLEQWAREQARAAGEALDWVRALLADDNPAGVTIETRAVVGTPAEMLLAVAESEGAALVATGTRGAGWLDRLVVGSVAQAVVREAGRAVLASPPPRHGAAVLLDRYTRGRATEVRPAEWPAVLDGFTRRNVGRRTRLEVSDPDTGTYAEEVGFGLRAAGYDPHGRRVELMLGDPDGRGRRLTHYAEHVEVLTVYAGPGGHDTALELAGGGGRTTLSFLEPPAVPPAGAA